jgi:hypothetical protein
MRQLFLHPIALASTALLVVNDHVLKAAYPGFVTGKLSDFAGMIVAPLVLMAALSALPLGTRARAWLPWVSALLVGILFSAAKTWAPATNAYEVTAALCRAPLRWAYALASGTPIWTESIQLVRDPTDLIALPMGLVAGVGMGGLQKTLAALTPSAFGPELSLILEDLRSPQRANGRYTWINPWGASLGFQGEAYGDELMQIRLRPEALLLRMIAAGIGGVSAEVCDLTGAPFKALPLSQVRSRIAGVFYARFQGPNNQGSFAAYCPGAPGGVSHREIFLSNLAMVAEYSYKTKAIAAALSDQAAKLALLAPAPTDGHLDPNACAWRRRVESGPWQSAPTDALTSYESSLCFLDAPYRPSTANLRALAQRLRAANMPGVGFSKTF